MKNVGMSAMMMTIQSSRNTSKGSTLGVIRKCKGFKLEMHLDLVVARPVDATRVTKVVGRSIEG